MPRPTTATGGGTLEYTQCGGSNVNSIQAYSDNNAPDVIAKIAADPGWGHYELYGLLRFLGGRVSFASTGNGKNYNTTGEGIGGGMIVPLVPRVLDFQVSGLIGQGVGRYGTSQIADATFNPSGKIEPLPAYSIMGGFVGHPIPAVDLYAYGGAEGVGHKAYAGTAGYGNPECEPLRLLRGTWFVQCRDLRRRRGHDRGVVAGYQIHLRHRSGGCPV